MDGEMAGRCERVREQLDPYFDGEISDKERSEFEAHLSQCGKCRAALEDLRLAWGALDSYSVEPAAAPSPDAVLRLARVRERRERRERGLKLVAGLAASILIGLLAWNLIGPAGDLGEGLSPSDRQEIVTNWDLLDNLDLLESLEVLENLDLLEEIPADALNGSENG